MRFRGQQEGERWRHPLCDRLKAAGHHRISPCPYPCRRPCPWACRCRGPQPCRGGLHGCYRSCHHAGRLGSSTRRAGCRRQRSQLQNPWNQPLGRQGVGYSAAGGRRGRDLTPRCRNRPAGCGVVDDQGSGNAEDSPKQRPRDDQELAERAKRSIHRASIWAMTPEFVADPAGAQTRPRWI